MDKCGASWIGMIGSIALVGSLVGGGLLAWSTRRGAPVREGARSTSIATIGSGRYRVRGRVVAVATSPSAVDGAACVYILRGEVEPSGIVREVRYELLAHAFLLDDGSGKVRVDPRSCVVDAPSVQGEAGLVVEHRIRVGEEIELVACFRPASASGMPYREGEDLLECEADASDPPRLAPSPEPLAEGLVRGAERTVARGAGAAIAFGSIVLAWLAG
jgi:hypothetical protein